MNNRQLRALVVDDVAIARDTIKFLLETRGNILLVGTAASGFEALQEVHNLKPDLVVMDVQMPGLSGLETARRLLEADPVTRIILISGDDTEEARQACKESGAHGFAPKDRLYHELYSEICRLFDLPPRPRSAEPRPH